MGFIFSRRSNPIYRNCIRLASQFHSRFHTPLSPQPLNFQHLDSSCLILSDNPFYKITKRWHLGHSQHDDGHQNHQHGISGREGEKIFRLGLVADIGLATGKAVTGYLSGSTAIIADAAHSISDVVLSGVALVSFRLAQAPRDKEHPYGHGKFETLGALGISCMLLATGGGIAWHAVELLTGLLSVGPEMVSHGVTSPHGHDHHHGIDMDHPVLALSMTIVSISIKEGLYWKTKRAGEKQGSGLMIANAWHHRVDAISSVVALIGVGGSILGVKFFDPLAGLVVSAMILKAGVETGRQSILELVDAAIPAYHLDPIRKTILQVEGVKGCHRLRGRRAGSCLYLDVNIEVDPFSSVSAAHDIGEAVRHQIHKLHHEVSEIFIHIDPAYSNIIPSITEEQNSLKDSVNQHYDPSGKENDIEATLANIISSNFAEKMLIQRITRHLFNGNIVLEIEVSMPPDILIRDAMRMAKEAESIILEAVDNVVYVNIHLCLRHPIPKLHR